MREVFRHNPNMPVRGFLYLADVYRKIIGSRELDLYHGRLVTLPYPNYIVFYNGTKEMQNRHVMRLSDSFDIRVCLKIHSRHLHAPLRGIFGSNSVSVAQLLLHSGQITHKV